MQLIICEMFEQLFFQSFGRGEEFYEGFAPAIADVDARRFMLNPAFARQPREYLCVGMMARMF